MPVLCCQSESKRCPSVCERERESVRVCVCMYVYVCLCVCAYVRVPLRQKQHKEYPIAFLHSLSIGWYTKHSKSHLQTVSPDYTWLFVSINAQILQRLYIWIYILLFHNFSYFISVDFLRWHMQYIFEMYYFWKMSVKQIEKIIMLCITFYLISKLNHLGVNWDLIKLKERDKYKCHRITWSNTKSSVRISLPGKL